MAGDASNTQLRPGSIPWPPILLLGSLIVGVVLGRLAALPWPGIDDTAARAVGIAFGLAGIVLLVWAAWTIRRHQTTILPHRGAQVLVTDGPYRYRRHPIYIADVLLMLGLAEVTKNVWFVVLAAAFAYLVTKLQIEPEERHLETRFGDTWRDYAARTRRML